jgi:hypothetical protein
MITQTVTTNDISSQYEQLATALETLNQHNSYDIYVRAGTVIIAFISVIVAFRLFYLNKNKDFRVKKAEIAGDIYSRYFDFRKAFLAVLKAELEDTAHSKLSFDSATESRINAITSVFTGIDKKFYERENTHLHSELELKRQELLRYIGQVRFYVSDDERKALKFHTINFQFEPWLAYNFDKVPSSEDLLHTFQSRIQITLHNEKRGLDDNINCIETILEDYAKYNYVIPESQNDEPNA